MRPWPRCVDDRGRPSRFVEGSLSKAIRGGAVEPDDRAGALRPLRDANALGLLAISLAGVGLMFAGAWMETADAGAGAWIIALACGGLAMLAAAVVQRTATAHAQKPVAKDLGRCPSCLRGLDDVRAAEDGCRVCPQCGSAWRLEVSAANTDARSAAP